MLASGGYREISAGSVGTWVEGNTAAERRVEIAPTPISLPPAQPQSYILPYPPPHKNTSFP